MDKAQIKVLEKFGYVFAEVEGLRPQPRATYYTINKNNGEVVEMPNLPADPYSLQHYLAKGFTLTRPDLKPQTKEGEFVCKVCGKRFTARIALLGHSRTHKNTVGGKK